MPTCSALASFFHRVRYKLTAFKAVSIQTDGTTVAAEAGAWSEEGTFIFIGGQMRLTQPWVAVVVCVL